MIHTLPYCLAAVAAFASGAGRVPAPRLGLPLVITENRGQAAPEVLFEARTPGLSYRFECDGFTVVGDADRSGARPTLALRFEGADPTRIEGILPLRARVHYLRGGGCSVHAPTFGGVAYRELLPGIDLIVRAHDGRIEYDLTVAPGASLDSVVIRCEGADGVARDAGGDLIISSDLGQLRQRAPVSWQVQDDGSAQALASRFRVIGEDRFGFEVEGRDPRLSLVVDPVLTYRSYVGGSEADVANGVAVDTEGAVYVAGSTESSDFPLQATPLDGTRHGREAVVFKLAPDGKTLVYATYIGGERDEEALGIAVDDEGQVYVVGRTKSVDFPVTARAWQRTPRGLSEAFALKLSADGSELLYSSYIGGSADDIAYAVCADSSGSVYVVGESSSPNFPTTEHGLQSELLGTRDAFVTKLDDQGAICLYSTLLGGSRDDSGFAVAVDDEGHAYVVGRTVSLDFPTSGKAADVAKDELDGFVAKLAIDGAELVWSTFLGGEREDEAHGVAVDGLGSVFVCGWTNSPDFPLTGDAGNPRAPRQRDGFLTRINPSGASFDYSILIGGQGADECLAVSLDSAGRAWVVGRTASADFSVSQGAFQAELSGASDGFAVRLDTSGGGPRFATLLGSQGDDELRAVAVDPVWGTVAVGGQSYAIAPSARGLFGVGAGASSDALISAFGRTACQGEAQRETLGGGCGVALTGSLPLIGQGLRLRVIGGAPMSQGAVLVSPVGADPLALGGCEVFLDLAQIERAFHFETDKEGAADLVIPIPENANLCGARFVLQGVIVAPATGPLPFGQLTEALQLTLGD